MGVKVGVWSLGYARNKDRLVVSKMLQSGIRIERLRFCIGTWGTAK